MAFKEAKYDNIPANIVDDYPRVSGARVCECGRMRGCSCASPARR
jgi:hypothetical protein